MGTGSNADAAAVAKLRLEQGTLGGVQPGSGGAGSNAGIAADTAADVAFW